MQEDNERMPVGFMTQNDSDQFLKYLLEFEDLIVPLEISWRGQKFNNITGEYEGEEERKIMNMKGINYLKSQIIPLITKNTKWGNVKREEAKTIVKAFGKTILKNIILHLEDYEIALENVESIVMSACSFVFFTLTMAEDGQLARLAKSQFHMIEQQQYLQEKKGGILNKIKFGGGK